MVVINTEKTEIKQDKRKTMKHLFKKGVSGNPKGRPPGSGISIVTELKKKLEETPEGQKATYLQLLINRIMKQAIQDGDSQMIRDIINRIDGMPKQSIDATSNGETLKGLIEVNYDKKED